MVVTVHAIADPLLCIECGADHYEKATQESVSSLPAQVQNALRARVWLICGVFLAVVALVAKLLLTLARDGVRAMTRRSCSYRSSVCAC